MMGLSKERKEKKTASLTTVFSSTLVLQHTKEMKLHSSKINMQASINRNIE